MSRVLHLIFWKKEAGAFINENLIALEHAFRHFVEVTAADEEESAAGHLDGLKIVGEGVTHLDGSFLESFGLKFILMDELGVSFENKQTPDQV